MWRSGQLAARQTRPGAPIARQHVQTRGASAFQWPAVARLVQMRAALQLLSDAFWPLLDAFRRFLFRFGAPVCNEEEWNAAKLVAAALRAHLRAP